MIRISSYREAEAYLLGTIDEVTSPRTSYKLDRMHGLLRHLGDPHRLYPTIHVGGTSGKGSTSTMIAGALRASGKRTGLHTKPHLHSMTERACIDGRPIPRERFAELLERTMPAIERTTSEYGRPTYYETLLALAFAYFAQERVDVAVIEVGLGGRLDGTNVLQPMVAAITSIGYDHTEILGTALEAIAFEKAGIAKPGVPLVLGPVPHAAAAVIEAYAARVGAPVVYARDVVQVDEVPPLPVLGIFQRTNAVTAIAVLKQLGEKLRPSRDATLRSFSELSIPGRMELASGKAAGRLRHGPQCGKGRIAGRLVAQRASQAAASITSSRSAKRRTRGASSRSWPRYRAPSPLRHTRRPDAARLRRRDWRRSPNRSGAGDVPSAIHPKR